MPTHGERGRNLWLSQTMKSFFFLFVMGCFASDCLLASDHIDGPVTTKHAVTDLTDLYAFPSLSRPGYWTLVLNVYPMAMKTSHFSSQVEYAFILREASVIQGRGGRLKLRTNAASERTITCRFDTPHDHASHTSTCDAGNGMKRTVVFNAVDAKPDRSGLLFYTGLRSDPFFFNAGWAVKWTFKGRLSPPAKSNTMTEVNVLSLVVELDVAALFGRQVGLVALVAQSSSLDGASGSKAPLDRVGRPEVTNILLNAHEQETELRDRYNLERPFRVDPANARDYLARVSRNIGFYDGMDGTTEWSDDARQAYAELMLEDYLVFNASMSSAADAKVGYFTIETDLLNGISSTALGGRKLTDDFMDRLYTLLINRGVGKSISDGVSLPANPISNTFPYLAPPSGGMMSWIKTRLGRFATGSH